MPNYDYVLAKIHAIHSKSVVGDNFRRLREVQSIEKLHKELFPEDVEPVMQRKLYNRVEHLLKKRIYSNISDVARFYNYKNQLVNNIIMIYEIDNIKIVLNSHLAGLKTIGDLPVLKRPDAIDYNFLYTSDVSDFRNISKLLRSTPFDFILPFVQKKQDIYFIENELDKFYYKNIIDSLKLFSGEGKEQILKILHEEINWLNIMWAFRTKIYYRKNFNDIQDSFITDTGLISPDMLKKIYELQLIPNEVSTIFKSYPKIYRELIIGSFNDDGDIDLTALEEKISDKLSKLYTKYFYIGGNVLAIISFIYIKKNEYKNVVKLVESLRYNLPMKVGEAS